MSDSSRSRTQLYTIGIDFGTLSARAVVVNVGNGDVLSCSESHYKHGILTSIPGNNDSKLPADWALQDPNDYIDSLETVVQNVIQQSGVAKKKVIGISIDFTSCTILPLDHKGTPLSNIRQYRSRPHAYVKLWKHHAAQPYADEINQKLTTFENPVKYFYGNRISAELLLPKILQILREDPELFAAMDTICEAGDWVNRTLTGELKRSVSMAGYKGMYFNDLNYPSDVFFRQIDPSLENCTNTILRGNICAMSERFGYLKPDWANRLGLCAGTSVGCAIIDSHAGIAGSGIHRPGQMMIALGTSSVQASLNRKPCASNGIIGTIRDAVIPGFYLWESGLAAVGDALSGFVNFLEAGNKSIAKLSESAEKLSVGENGLIALDWWNGNKTPFVDSNLSGLIIGLRTDTTQSEIFRAFVESTGFGTRSIFEQFQLNGAVTDELIACGGIAHKNSSIMQIYSDIIGREIKIVKNEQTMAIGAAIYAAVAAGSNSGGYDKVENAVKAMVHEGTCIYRPDPNRKQKYNELYKIYMQLVAYFGQENTQIMHQLTQLRRSPEQTMRRE